MDPLATYWNAMAWRRNKNLPYWWMHIEDPPEPKPAVLTPLPPTQEEPRNGTHAAE
jgi:hypothetical protein